MSLSKKQMKNSNDINLSFAGCGFLGIYHVGVAVCFKKFAPHLLLDKISGASAGALAACCLLCDMPLGEMTNDFFRVVNEARQHSLGPFSPNFNIQTCLLEGLQKFLPPDAHTRVNGKLHISLTRVYDGKNVIVSHYNSREDLLNALLCACFIPVFSGILPPRFHGVRYMDGAFSDNLPSLNHNTVTVSPFCGESDVCPRDNTWQMFHINWANTSIEISTQNADRMKRILFPPSPEVLSKMCQSGFEDGLRFLHKNNLINCAHCLSVQSSYSIQSDEDRAKMFEDKADECAACLDKRNEAKEGNMPESVQSVFNVYIQNANKGFLNWLFRHQSVRLLKNVITLPATIPFEIFCATVTKILTNAPSAGQLLIELSKLVLEAFGLILKTPQDMQITGNFHTELTEYDVENGESRKKTLGRKESKVNINMDKFDQRLNYETEIKATTEKHEYVLTSTDVDSFEHLLAATKHQESIYMYYYFDDEHKDLRKIEFFETSCNNELEIICDKQEDNHAKQVEYDSDGDPNQNEISHLPESQSISLLSYSNEKKAALRQTNSCHAHIHIDEDEASLSESDNFYQPEADQLYR